MTAYTPSAAVRRGVSADRSALPMMLRGGVVAVVALLPVAAVVGLIAHGVDGLLGASVGVAVSALIFLMGYIGMKWVLEALHPNSSMAGALGIYCLQVSLMFPALIFLTNVDGLHARSVALGALFSALLWLAGQLWGFMRSRTPLFDVELPGGSA